MTIPRFESEFLSDVEAALRKRHKAIKHLAFGIACERLYEVQAKEKIEKMELTLSGPRSSRAASLRLFAWSDRWLWTDAREGTKVGWKWEWTIEGRLLGKYGGRELIKAVEESFVLSPFVSDKPSFREEAHGVWDRLLARKPKLVL